MNKNPLPHVNRTFQDSRTIYGTLKKETLSSRAVRPMSVTQLVSESRRPTLVLKIGRSRRNIKVNASRKRKSSSEDPQRALLHNIQAPPEYRATRLGPPSRSSPRLCCISLLCSEVNLTRICLLLFQNIRGLNELPTGLRSR